MKSRLDMNKIAKALGAERKGKVRATGGYFGAAQLAADIEERFRVPDGGGRPTDPRWTERRLIGLSTETLRRLQEIATGIRKTRHIHLNAMQIAALSLEKAIGEIRDVDELTRGRVARKARPARKKAPAGLR
jgi:predicted transcriptional regulator